MDLSDSIVDHLRHVAAQPDLTGTRYVLEAELGRGGLGIVYAAHDRDLNRQVALKVLEPGHSAEAQLIARLEHPGVVPIYETGSLPDGRSYYTMKLVSGQGLDRYLSRTTSESERLRIMRRIAEVLGFAHSRGVVHRDLKPQNIMIGEFGEVYVLDWGIEAVAGTAAFRAPEKQLDRRSDIYSLGTLMQLALPAASPALGAIAQKAMSADPDMRYASATAFLADINRYEEGQAVEAWHEPFWHRLRRFAVRNAVLLWLLAAYAATKFLLFFLRAF